MFKIMFVHSGLIIFQICLRLVTITPADIIIAHTSSLSSRYGDIVGDNGFCSNVTNPNCNGGYCRLYAKIKKLRATGRLIYINTGNTLGGGIYWTLHQSQGAVDMVKFNEAPYTVLGSHDMFHHEEMIKYIKSLQPDGPKYLGVNLKFTDGSPLSNIIQKSDIITIDETKIGLIGFSCSLIAQTAQSKAEITIEDEIAAIGIEVKRLEYEGVSVIIVYGFATIEIAKEIIGHFPQIDIMVTGGLSNDFKDQINGIHTDYPTTVIVRDDQTSIILRSFGYTKYIGILKFSVEGGNIISQVGELFPLDHMQPKDQDCVAVVTKLDLLQTVKLNTSIEALKKVVIPVSAHIPTDNVRFDCITGECTMGNLIADAVFMKVMLDANDFKKDNLTRYFSNVNFVLIPAIDITSGINVTAEKNKSMMTAAEILNTIGHEIELSTFTISGLHLQYLIEEMIHVPKGIEFLQVSGLQLRFDYDYDEEEYVVTVHVRCANCLIAEMHPLRIDGTYTGITASHILSDGLIATFMDTASGIQKLNFTIFDALTSYFKQDFIKRGAHQRIVVNLSQRVLANWFLVGTAVLSIFGIKL